MWWTALLFINIATLLGSFCLSAPPCQTTFWLYLSYWHLAWVWDLLWPIKCEWKWYLPLLSRTFKIPFFFLLNKGCHVNPSLSRKRTRTDLPPVICNAHVIRARSIGSNVVSHWDVGPFVNATQPSLSWLINQGHQFPPGCCIQNTHF